MTEHVPELKVADSEPIDFVMRFAADGANLSPYQSICSLSGCPVRVSMRIIVVLVA